MISNNGSMATVNDRLNKVEAKKLLETMANGILDAWVRKGGEYSQKGSNSTDFPDVGVSTGTSRFNK